MFAVNFLSFKSLCVIKLLRHLVFLCLKYNIWLKVKFVPEKFNILADSLSRFQILRF